MPEDAPLPPGWTDRPKKKRPRKPKPNHHQQKQMHERQLNWWLADELTDAQQYQVKDLQAKLPQLKAQTEALLALLAELKQGTIDRILEMSDEELALKVLRLRGELKLPGQE